MKRSLLLGLVASSFGLAFAPRAQAAPGLGFDVSVNIAPGGKSALPPQLMKARVLLSGQRARIETSGAGSPAVVLYSAPYVYRLLPAAKAGVKWKLAKNQVGAFGQFDPQQMLRNPAQLRATLVQQGAKLTGKSQIGGVAVDVFELSKASQRVSHLKAFLRHSDSFPVRLEAQSSGFKVVANWSHYTRLANVPAAQFAPPKGYAIRESQNPPSVAVL